MEYKLVLVRITGWLTGAGIFYNLSPYSFRMLVYQSMCTYQN